MQISACAWSLLLWGLAAPFTSYANPYLAKLGEAPTTIYIATCAVSGGFTHLYAALDYNLLDKYGVHVKHVVIRGGTNLSLAALATDEIQFLYCAGDATIPGLATGIDATLVAAPLVGLPYVLIAHRDIKTIQDLKGKSIGVGTVAGLPARLLKIFIKRFNLEDVQIRPLGGSQPERYNALLQGVVHAAPFTPPLDARGKRDGFNVLYYFNDLGLPAVYSSLHTNSKSLKERRVLVQRVVAALAEAVHFVEHNPEKGKASAGKALKLKDEEALQSSYDAYAKRLINRRLIVPVNAVADAVEIARDSGTKVTKKGTDVIDNTFAENLDKSGFLKELWRGKVP